MMFNVMTVSSGFGKNTVVKRVVVTDQPDDYDTQGGYRPWPCAAEFAISMRYDRETQERRAVEYCDYLNKGIVVQPPIGT